MNTQFVYIMRGVLLTVVVLGAMVLGQWFAESVDRYAMVRQQNETLRSGTGTDNLPSSDTHTSNNTVGSQLYKSNCAFCHSITKDLSAPALRGVTKRIPDKKTIYKWVHNPAAMLKAGEPYFVNLQKQYGGLVMTSFPNLSEEEIDAILDYIEE